MKNILDCFDYLKKYHSDILDVLGIVLSLLVLKRCNPEYVLQLIQMASKKIDVKYDLNDALNRLVGGCFFIPHHSNLNISKVLKSIYLSDAQTEKIESFLHVISQRRTTNKLYYFSTPKEVNDLLVMLLDLQDGDRVYNPCYGIGSVFLSMGIINKNISLFGEELDERLSNIAKLVAKLSQVNDVDLRVNDILKRPTYKNKNGMIQFDKVICNPPLYSHVGIEQLKEDERFIKMGIVGKNYPELAFLTHALSHLKNRGIFIVRNQTLQKSFLEEKLREKLVHDRMIEAVIELPKNIFPHQWYDFSILVISHNNNSILHINASHPHFFMKDGKYNQLVNIHEIVDIFKNKSPGFYSKVTPIEEIKVHDLRASYYLADSKINHGYLRLGDLDVDIFRGQRVYGGNKDTPIEYYDVGIADFSPCGFSYTFDNKKLRGDTHKIHKYRLKPYDILLSLRGTAPKMTILSENIGDFIAVANSGIIIIRLKNKEEAISVYCFFFSQKGFDALCDIYEKNGGNMIYINELLEVRLPRDYMDSSIVKMAKIEEIRRGFETLDARLERLKQS